MKMIKFTMPIVGAVLVFLFAFAAPGVFAESGMRISPLTYNFEIDPGESQEAKIIVTNRSNEPLNYVTEIELFSDVSEDGAPSFTAKSPQQGITTLMDWVQFKPEDKEGEIAPGAQKELFFNVYVPEGAEPGGHYAGIFVKQVKKTAEGLTEIGVASRLGLLMLVSVPGDVIRTGEIKDFSVPKLVWGGPVDLELRVKNTGTVHYDSKADISAKSLIGSITEAKFEQRPDGTVHDSRTLIPNSTRVYDAVFDKKYPFGRYVFTANALDGDGRVMTTTAVMWAIPLIIIIPSLVGLLVLILLINYLRRHLKFVSDKK